MADYTMAADEFSTDEITLAAGVVKSVQLSGKLERLRVEITGPAIRCTVDGTTNPSTSPKKAIYLPGDSSGALFDLDKDALVQLVSPAGGSVVVLQKGGH